MHNIQQSKKIKTIINHITNKSIKSNDVERGVGITLSVLVGVGVGVTVDSCDPSKSCSSCVLAIVFSFEIHTWI